MSYTLIGSYTSPFTRKLRLAMHERVPHTFRAINYFEKEGETYLRSINPINKIPLLLDGDQPIFESRIIYHYLEGKMGWQPLSIDEENIVSAIDGAMESCANLFLLRRGGLDLATDNWYVQRQKERLPNIFTYITPWVEKMSANKQWYFPTMTLYSFLYWGQFREMINLEPHPSLRAFLDSYRNMPGVAETNIPAQL